MVCQYKTYLAGDNIPETDQKENEPSSRKKRKAATGQPVEVQGIEVESRAELKGHTDAATAVLWAESDIICSGSMDHSVSTSSSHPPSSPANALLSPGPL